MSRTVLRVPVRARHRYRSESLDLGPFPEAVPLARRHAHGVLEEWGLSELADDTGQIVSELVTNAVQAHRREGLDAPVGLTLLGGPRTVLVVVRDAGNGTPRPASPGPADARGRGLVIVDALAAHWDVKPCPGGGKVVRALVRGGRR